MYIKQLAPKRTDKAMTTIENLSLRDIRLSFQINNRIVASATLGPTKMKRPAVWPVRCFKSLDVFRNESQEMILIQFFPGFEIPKSNPTCKRHSENNNNNILDFCHIFFNYLNAIASKVAYPAHQCNSH